MARKTLNYEEKMIEGYDDFSDEALDLGDYPIESLLIRQEARTISGVISRIDKGRYILDPDFQRDYIWDTKKASKLIESVIMRIPIPVFYLAERYDGRVIIVDGLQRLTSFFNYCNNRFKLTDLTNSNLNNRYFSDLPVVYQERIEDTNLIFYLIDPKVPEKIRLDIFDRVNSGIPLTRQQMRNSLFSGESTRWLKRMSNLDIFQKVTTSKKSLNPKLMRDREFINRYCGFLLLGPEEYGNLNTIKGDMDNFLARTLELMNQFSKDKLYNLEQFFIRSMKNNYFLFGSNAFRRYNFQSEQRNVINASLFDVFSVLMAYIPEETCKSSALDLQNKFILLMENQRFIRSITSGTSDVKNVLTRFDIAIQEYEEYIDVNYFDFTPLQMFQKFES